MKRDDSKTQGKIGRKPPPQRRGRKTANNAELWARRIKELRLWSMGVTKTEIAHQFNITCDAVRQDLEAMRMIEPAEEALNKIASHYEEVIRTAFQKVNEDKVPDSSKVGYLREINEAAQRLARLRGLDKEQTNYFINQTMMSLNAGSKNKYDEWNDDKLQEEFKRRRLGARPGNT